jgi:DNA polymerase delta subunit 1
MPATTVSKRVLGEQPNAGNKDLSSNSAKKRKLDSYNTPANKFKSTQNGKLGSSQPSHFESEVLEKLTSQMSGLKQRNSEKDQQWARPSMDDFKANEEPLIFQQIEVEEGHFFGGQTTLRLFGVTEVCLYSSQ